jgi:hypothetical protein
MRITMTCSAVLAAAAMVHGVAQSQNVPVRTLSRPDAEYAEPFTQIAGVRELRDGRVITVDPRDKIIQVIDMRSGAAEKIGREGSGPGEYALPMRLVPLPGDSSGVLDPLNNRLLVILPNAKPGGFLDLAAARGGGRGGMVMSGASALQADGRGRLYSQGSPIRMVGETPQTSDSVAIERLDRASGKRDTLAFLQLPKGSSQVSGSRGNVSIRIGGASPYASQDQWAVAQDGRIAIVRLDPYRVDFIDPAGARRSGSPIATTRLRLSEGHKQEWRDQQRNATGLMMTVGPSGERSAQVAPMRNVEEPSEWPEYLPAFPQGAVSYATDGMVWVRRHTPAGEPPTFDVIDGNGRLAFKVVLPKRARLVGFGNGTVYVARLDEDDLQYLQRYRLPTQDRP